MKKNFKNSHQGLMILVVICLFGGAFFTGAGIWKVVSNHRIRLEYVQSELQWKQDLVEGTEGEVARDQRNQSLIENMKYISLERQIYFEDARARGTARISNDNQSEFHCQVTMVRDATGEVLYESGLIEPGHYIEEINLKGSLKKGYYPCTAVWSFYSEHEEYAGETAWKIVIIVKN